ncbi:MAG: zinc ribbon domain-containing protein [Chloroflexi bacterium]|nr:zinc ribbon domain-containing protein [Ardenticatenaceae bacterium]MBL1128441.1 zinc ribbon domain-containing protein [Chloroflexota bacterium]NOG34519.1 zinc ribbon domain-containing protein [Chloroflexota bacterium]
MFTEVACPNCLHPIDIRQHGRHVTCAACQSQFVLDGHICPRCNAYHAQEQGFCGECGAPLTRVCQKCRTSNWAGDEFCKQCGTAMDILELLKVNYAQTTADRLHAHQEWAREIKAKEESDSQRRMAQLMAQEQARLAEMARLRAAQSQKDKHLFLLINLFAFLFLVIVALFIQFF